MGENFRLLLTAALRAEKSRGDAAPNPEPGSRPCSSAAAKRAFQIYYKLQISVQLFLIATIRDG